MEWLRRLGAALGLLAVLACVPTAGATTWHDALDQAAAAPAIDKTAALRLYALALGPVPGVRVSRKGLGRIDSADPALDAVLSHYRSLSAKQLRAVGLRVVRRHRHRHGHRARAAQGGVTNFYPTFGTPGRQEDTALTAIAKRFRAVFARRLGLRPSFDVHVFRTAFAFGRAGPAGDSAPFGAGRDTTTKPVDCEIQVNRLNTLIGVRGVGTGLEETLAHEVFHCYQAQILGSWSAMWAVHERSPWLVEGGAEWAGCQAHSGPIAQGWFQSYLGAPASGLFARSYDAIGVFDEIAYLGTDPFTTVAAALRATSDVAAYTALAGAGEEHLEESLSASFAQDDSRGVAWTMAGPCYRARAVTPAPVAVKPDARPQTMRVGAAAATLTRLGFADGNYLLTVDVDSGRARISAGGVDDVIAPGADPVRYCVGTCTCQGTLLAGITRTLSRGGPAVLLGLTGNPIDGGSATLTATPIPCLGITSATFTSSDATFTNVTVPDQPSLGFQWTSTQTWNVAFGRTALSARSYDVGTIVASGGTYTTQRPSQPQCTGMLSLDTPDSPRDPWLTVVNDFGTGTGRHWLISLTPTSYGAFFQAPGSTCPSPDFNRNVVNPRWTATVDLHATADPTEHTETFAVASDPAHADKENWTGTVTITGTW